MSDPNAGELGPAITPAAAPAPAPAAKVAPVGQHQLDVEGQKRWNAPPDKDGSIQRWREREQARLGVRPAADPAAPAKPDQPAVAKPADGAADKTLRVGDTTVTEAELSEFLTNKAARESGRLQAPDSPDGYKIELPKDFKAPLGVEVAFNQADPALGQLRAWAHSHGIEQSAFSDLLGVYAGHQASQLAIGKLAHEAEVAKLGSAGPGRIDALAQWLRGTLGDQGKILSGVRDAKGNVHGGVLWTAEIVGALESLMNRNRSQGAASYTGHGRDMGDHSAGKIAGYSGMSFEQRRHAQEQRRAR